MAVRLHLLMTICSFDTEREMKVGDLVYAIYDRERGLNCVGIVLEVKRNNALVLWSSEGIPMGWWRENQLEVMHESR